MELLAEVVVQYLLTVLLVRVAPEEVAVVDKAANHTFFPLLSIRLYY